MKRFVSIWLPSLSTDWFELRDPGLRSVAFVLVKTIRGRMVISHANQQAQKKGVLAGMVLADAKAIYPSLQKFDEPSGLENRLLQKLSEWCIRFTPVAAVDPLGGIILDASGCSHLWGSDENYIHEIQQKLKDRGYHTRAAIADTIGCAWAMARFGRETMISPDGHAQALLHLPPEALRLDDNTIECLNKLGLKNISSFISFPRSSLRRRFGIQLLQRLDQALGIRDEFIHAVHPPETFREWLPCPDPVSHLEGIEYVLDQLLRQICLKLQKKGKGIRSVIFKGHRTDNKLTEIGIATSNSSTNASHLFHLFQLKLSLFEPGLGIELFTLEATKVEDFLPGQSQFWKENSMNDQQLSELIDRLAMRIGNHSIYRYLPDEHYWPERSFRKAGSFNELSDGEWKLDRPRPLRLLSPPERIEVTAPVPDYPPMLFRYKGKLHKIKKADGPERIEQEWWIQEGQHRDYYAVEDEEGGRYWLYRSGHYQVEKKASWFIHGFFS